VSGVGTRKGHYTTPVPTGTNNWFLLESLPAKIGTDTLCTLADGLGFGDAEVAHVAGMLDVGTTADFHGVVADFVDFDEGAVAVAEEGECALIESLPQGHYFHCDLEVALNLLVDDFFDAANLFGCELLWVREVETEALRRDVASHLVDMRSEYVA